MVSWLKRNPLRLAIALALSLAAGARPAAASEADLVLPDLGSVAFFGVAGSTLLLFGLGVCVLGMVFGLVMYTQLKNLPVHRSMREISELIYETCKTYLITQGKFILLLWAFIARDHRLLLRLPAALPVRPRRHHPVLLAGRHRRQLRRRLVRHPHQHLRQLAHGLRRACAASRSRPTPSRSRPA